MSILGFPNLLEDCAQIKISNPSKWVLNMHSRAGERTGIYIDDLKIALDCGLATKKNVIAVLMTHKHCDHSHMVPMVTKGREGRVIIKGQETLSGRPLYVPKFMKRLVARITQVILMTCDDEFEECDNEIEESEKLSGLRPDKYSLMTDDELFTAKRMHVEEVSFGDKFIIPGLPDIQVEVLKAYHTCNCNGYGFSTIKRNIIKSEYRHLTQTKEGRIEIKKLIDEGNN